ncbi:MAG: hypothetical protein JWQ35_1796 [Bacteriovoracaceae bacterium]|nr:hypothetical protein [Bacteriovoracaceae bacterium]
MFNRKILFLSFLFLSIIITSSGSTSAEGNTTQESFEFDSYHFSDQYCSWKSKRNFERQFKDYTIRVSSDGEIFRCDGFEITKAGRVVFPLEENDKFFEWNHLLSRNKNGKPEYLLNLIGKGNTQIAVESWGGGNMGPGYLFIFDLATDFKQIAKLETGEIDSPKFKDLDGDGIPEIIFKETLYGTQFGCHACHPNGTVILKYKNGQYVVDENLMYKPEPTDVYISKHIEEWQKEIREDSSPTKFYQALTTLIYTGHADQARRFIDRVWPDDIDGENEFVETYRESLSESSYLSRAARELE